MNDNLQKESVVSVFNQTANIAVYNNGEKSLFFKGDDKFESILNSLYAITNDSNDMPALGVALNSEVVNAKQQGVWIELVFDSEKSFNDMPFECLLFEVNPKNSGFNLIRKTNGKYDGRCFYLSLQNDMKLLSKTLTKLLNQ